MNERANDLIYRQAAIEALESIGSLDTEADKKYARSVFEALPSAEPVSQFKWERDVAIDQLKKLGYELGEKPRRGKNISQDGFLCSECKFGDFGGFHGYEPNFCPNCGADMRGE